MAKLVVEDDDINLLHKIFYRKVCAQISACEQKIVAYEQLKGAVSGLSNQLVECVGYLKNTYSYASSGVSCAEFDGSIAKISDYAVDVQNNVATLEGVMSSINSEIQKLRNQIAGLKSQIGL